MRDGGILPRNLCQECLEKLQVAHDLKTKSKESDKYLKEILMSSEDNPDEDDDQLLTPYEPTTHPYYNHDEDDSLLQPVDEDDDDSKDSEFNLTPRKGKRSGLNQCPICHKEFKYSKPFRKHVKEHNAGSITKKGLRRQYFPKIKAVDDRAFVQQAPYDSKSPYESPAPYASPPRAESPDFGMMVTSSSFLNGSNDPVATRPRMRKQLLTTLSVEQDVNPEVKFFQPKPRGRGRPRKIAVDSLERSKELTPESVPEPSKAENDNESYKSESDEEVIINRKRSRAKPQELTSEEEEEAESLLEGFTEVDVSRMLKKTKSDVFNEESFSHSGPSSVRGRSRSASVELIDDTDIFGESGPSNGEMVSLLKTTYGSGNTFGCTVAGCGKKFHLRANLKKHLRETHGKN